MATLVSRVNGLKIAIPPDARNVVRRYDTQGDNELIFDHSKTEVGDKKARGASATIAEVIAKNEAKASKPRAKAKAKTVNEKAKVDDLPI